MSASATPISRRRAATTRVARKTSAQRTARGNRLPQAPPGLALAFKMVQSESSTAVAASFRAAKAYRVAKQLIASLHVSDQDDTRDEVMDSAIGAMFPEIERPFDASTAVEAGFAVGFAACWLLMTSVAGGAR